MDAQLDQAEKPILLSATHAKDAPAIQGRREYFNYYDLGVREATGGWMRAERITSSKGLPQATGWHYHTCKVQFVYQLTGWVELAFEDGTVFHMEAGDTALIPGGCRHNEIAASAEFSALEMSIPAEMGTVACEAPSSIGAGDAGA